MSSDISDNPVRVLVVDDMALVRNTLARGLALDPNIEVVGTAPDPYVARDKILQLRPDVMTLDIEMPRMDGIEFLRRLMPQYPIPVIMVSSMTRKGAKMTLDALEAGAVDFVTKPTSDIARGLNVMLSDLRERVKAASTIDVAHWRNKNVQFEPTENVGEDLVAPESKIIGIGASTGGTEALRKMIPQFPKNMPGTIVVQHMPAGFTSLFAERLNEESEVTVVEASDGDLVTEGRVYIAPGGYHIEVVPSNNQYKVRISKGEPVCGHSPSVDVLFKSLAEHGKQNAIGVILTGMGKDGAEGMRDMADQGGATMVQDEESSVVFGMASEALNIGATENAVPLNQITKQIILMLSQ